MWCAHCGRREEDCPNGIWRGGRTGSEGICVYCARAALRALGDIEPAGVIPIYRAKARLAEPPEAA